MQGHLTPLILRDSESSYRQQAQLTSRLLLKNNNSKDVLNKKAIDEPTAVPFDAKTPMYHGDRPRAAFMGGMGH